ncbi:MAG: hypothetical protein ACRD21_25125 [Vicinamibacteria bacterium]
MTRPLLLSFLLLSFAGWASAEERLRVFVHVDPRIEDLDPKMRRELIDSMSDLREQILKRRDIAIAKDRSEADILVTLVDRRIEVNRSGATQYFGYTQTHYQSRYVLGFRLSAGSLDFESETALAGAFVTWKRVAGVLAKDIEQWARDHRDEMLGEPAPLR